MAQRIKTLLLLGSNVGDVEQNMQRAVELLCAEGGVGERVAISTLHKTSPWGFQQTEEVAQFANQALLLETRLAPEELLVRVLEIENIVGRDRALEQDEKEARAEKYASRVMDIDIIFYGEGCYESERLRLPHPLMQDREFVLRPMMELCPAWCHPVLGLNCEQLLDKL